MRACVRACMRVDNSLRLYWHAQQLKVEAFAFGFLPRRTSRTRRAESALSRVLSQRSAISHDRRYCRVLHRDNFEGFVRSFERGAFALPDESG
jgi:hypothetical protein